MNVCLLDLSGGSSIRCSDCSDSELLGFFSELRIHSSLVLSSLSSEYYLLIRCMCILLHHVRQTECLAETLVPRHKFAQIRFMYVDSFQQALGCS